MHRTNFRMKQIERNSFIHKAMFCFTDQLGFYFTVKCFSPFFKRKNFCLPFVKHGFKMNDILNCLLEITEKSSEIAREIRWNPVLLARLVQEKSESSKNARFVQDFKTLADVLIQELAKHELKRFPRLAVYGEENGEIVSESGGTTKICIGSNTEETKTMLLEALDGDGETAGLLSRLVHRPVQIHPVKFQSLELNMVDNFGIWIDPIGEAWTCLWTFHSPCSAVKFHVPAHIVHSPILCITPNRL